MNSFRKTFHGFIFSCLGILVTATTPLFGQAADGETGYVEIDGRQIYYRIKGEGPPLVFVHGWTLNLSYWDAQVAYLSSKYTTYSYDWRGMGKSSGGASRFSMEDLAEELKGFIDAMGIENPIICGHSEGGAIAAQYAATHPDSVAILILADTDINYLRERTRGLVELAFTELFGYLPKRKGENPLEGMMPNLQEKLYSADFIQSHPEFIAAWQQQFLSNSYEVVINALRAWYRRPNLTKPLKEFKAPVLFLWGTEDVMIPLRQMQQMQAVVGGISQLTSLEGSGHMTPVEVPDTFNKVMETFLEQNFLP